MYDVYKVVPLVSHLPLQIDAITCHEQAVLLGTKNGYLISCNRSPPSDDQQVWLDHRRTASPFSPNLPLQTYKSFAKKSVSQLFAIPQFNLLVSLSDSTITVHDCIKVNFPIVSTHTKSRGVSCFALAHRYPDYLKMCVATKRRIQMFTWNGSQFDEVPGFDVSFSETPRSMVLCEDSVAVALRDEYFLVNPRKTPHSMSLLRPHSEDEPPLGPNEPPPPPETITLFNTGSQGSDPVIVAVNDEMVFGFLRSDTLVFRQLDGSVSTIEDIMWSEVPSQIVYDPPFLIAVVPSQVEIRSLHPSILVQTVKLNKPKLLTRALPLQVYACNPSAKSEVWCLTGTQDAARNVQNLVDDGQFEIAVRMIENMSESPSQEKLLSEIRTLWAFALFEHMDFVAAFKLYRKVGAELLYVIGLIPGLLPDQIRSDIPYPRQLPDTCLAGQQLTKALEALQSYFLVETRVSLLKELSDQAAHAKQRFLSEEEQKREKDVRGMLQILDTTLLKCYLQTNEMLVPSLLRLPDNSCSVAESERVLREHKKLAEVFILYEQKGLHKEALELLREQAHSPSPQIKGALEKTILYLQNLGKDHLRLIFEYGSWVIRKNEVHGVRIFADDLPEVEELPRDLVFEFIRKEKYSALIPYLEYIIERWSDPTPKFHTALGEEYITKVKTLMSDYLQSLPEGHSVAPAGKEPDKLGQYRSKLLDFLESSKFYSAEVLLAQIPHDAMFEERALLLGRLGKHEPAIAIYTNVLHDYDRAVRYCNMHYRRDNINDSEVYILLLRMYANPPDNAVIGLMQSRLPRPRPNISFALRVLTDYSGYIDTVKAIELLPPDQKLEKIWCALESLLHSARARRSDYDLRRGLTFTHKLKSQNSAMGAQNVKWTITNNTKCASCGKPIGKSAFAWQPGNRLVHYFCYKHDL